jgi:hypothetical protein
VNLGPFASYRLPANVQSAFGVETAEQLADQLGVTAEFSPALAYEAENAYKAYRQGDTTTARGFLKDRLGMSDDSIDAAFEKASRL